MVTTLHDDTDVYPLANSGLARPACSGISKQHDLYHWVVPCMYSMS